jgi:hypothetical protein
MSYGPSWSSTNTWRVIDRPEYTFDVEELRNGDAQMIFIHLDVHVWKKSVLKRLLTEFKAFRSVTDVPLFVSSPDSDAKWVHFISLFGFKYLLDMAAGRKLYVSHKDNNNGQLRNNEDVGDGRQRAVEGAVPVPTAGL